MPHYTGREHPATDELATEPAPVLPWSEEPAAVTAPQTVVTGGMTDEERTKMHRRIDAEGLGRLPADEEVPRPPRHRGQPKHGFRWGTFLFCSVCGLVVVAWVVVAYKLGQNNAPTHPVPTETVTKRPAARPGPRTTVRVPGPLRVVTKTRTTTARVTVTRTVTATPTPDTADPGQGVVPPEHP